MTSELSTQPDDIRHQAVIRLRKKREFLQHLTTFVVINLALVITWWMTTPGGFFWPMFPLFGWGIGVIFHGIDAYASAPREETIRREMARLSRS